VLLSPGANTCEETKVTGGAVDQLHIVGVWVTPPMYVQPFAKTGSFTLTGALLDASLQSPVPTFFTVKVTVTG
jgi:hypothetical protein